MTRCRARARHLEGDFIDWLTIKSETKSVTSDVRHIRSHTLVPGLVSVYGYVYDVKNGRLVEVPEATKAGAASIIRTAGSQPQQPQSSAEHLAMLSARSIPVG